MIARHIYIVLLLLLASCGPAIPEKVESPTTSTAPITVPTNSPADSSVPDPAEDNYATYYIVIADTGLDYFILHKKMFGLHASLHIPIDTMERTYNTTKNLIALPDNSEDEAYAGEYFPRRLPSESLSLEYLNFYHHQAGSKTIALVTGIYETARSADSALALLQTTDAKAFRLKAVIYVGCIH